MPITDAIARVLDGDPPVRDAVEALLRREPNAREDGLRMPMSDVRCQSMRAAAACSAARDSSDIRHLTSDIRHLNPHCRHAS